MNLAATLAIFGGGPGSGCQGENCGRPPTGTDRPTPLQSPRLYLELSSPRGYPIIFDNSIHLNWHWTKDKSFLIISNVEETDDSALGMGVKTVYKIPAKNIHYWGPEENSPTYQYRKQNSPTVAFGPHQGPAFMMAAYMISQKAL